MLKRSEINRSIDLAMRIFKRAGVALPPFAQWSPTQWLEVGQEAEEIRRCMLGWDVTDFGSGNFKAIGRTLFTLRNGHAADTRYAKPYAEKLLLDPEGQRAPCHYHASKREDIINVAGGNVLVQLAPCDANGQAASGWFEVQVDGCTRRLKAGGTVCLKPGESLCIPPRTLHQFWGEAGTGFNLEGTRYTVSREISSVCDDLNDNYFLEPAERFPKIQEDEPPLRLLCHEYPGIHATRKRPALA